MGCNLHHVGVGDAIKYFLRTKFIDKGRQSNMICSACLHEFSYL